MGGGVLPLCRGKCPAYDTKFDGEAPVMLELWEIWKTTLLPLLPVYYEPEGFYLKGFDVWVK